MSFRDKTQLTDSVYEISQHPVKIVEKYPLHCGLTVLQLSKLNLMNFILFVYDFLEPESFELVYSGTLLICTYMFVYARTKILLIDIITIDTDSICLTTIAELDDIVKPEKRRLWPEAKNTWFVRPSTGDIEADSRDARWPGKMKLEWSSETGSIIW